MLLFLFSKVFLCFLSIYPSAVSLVAFFSMTMDILLPGLVSKDIIHLNWCLGVVATTDVVEACTGVNIAVMVGGFPRKEGMERKDVMSKNVSIYKSQASALENHAAANCKVSKIADASLGYMFVPSLLFA